MSNKVKCDFCEKKCWSVNKRCKDCRSKHSLENYSELKLGDKTYTKHKHAKYAYIRYYAKRKAIELGWSQCCKCGYDKHFEVAHKKAISEFSKDALLTDINHEDNLIPLCPNCHWEYDNLPKKQNKCIDCQVTISTNATRCRKCKDIHVINTNKSRPSKNQLIQDKSDLKYFTKIGKKYNITDNGVRKWFRFYNIPLK